MAKDRGSIDQIICELSNDLRVLGEQAQQDFESFERAVHERFVAAERTVLAGELQGLDVDVPEVTIGGRCLRRVLRSTETYLSGVGPITVQRTLYRAGSESAVVALELRAGIVAGHWTPLAARQASLLVAHMTPQESVDTLRELGNMSPSRSSLDRLPKHLSSRWEQDREGFEDALRAATREVPAEAATLAVSLDGVMAPMKVPATAPAWTSSGHDVRLPRLHPMYGTDAEGRDGGPTDHGEEPLRASREGGARLVQTPSAPADHAPAGAPVAGPSGPLRLLRTDGEPQTTRMVPPASDPLLANVALTPPPRGSSELGSHGRTPETAPVAASEAHFVARP